MILYLNNTGHRWIDTDGMPFVLVLPNGERKLRKAKCYEAFGNFAVIVYSYKGRQYKALPKAYDGGEVRDPKTRGVDAYPHVFHEENRHMS